MAWETKPPVRISGVSFSLLGADDIEKDSVVQVQETSIYQKNVPREGGVADHRMGTVDRRISCGTCKQDVLGCNGHFGHMVLPIPCYSAFLLVNTLKVLRSVCYFCSRLLVTTHTYDPDTGKRTRNIKVAILLRQTPQGGTQRFQALTRLAKTKTQCPHCEAMQPTYTKHVNLKTFGIHMQWSEEAMKQWEPLTPEEEPDEKERQTKNAQREAERKMALKPFTSIDAYNILKHMHPDDIALLGMEPKLSHPKKFMITVLKVPPPVIRPSVVASEGSRSRGQNDLTRKLLEIIKQTHLLQNLLKDHPRAFEEQEIPKVVLDVMTELQYHVATYMNNPIRGLKVSTSRSGAPLKGLQQRIKGKGGRIRGNLTGKRVDFSSRTVVSPDPNLDVDQVGVPRQIAQTLTIEERVTPFNIADLQQRVLVGAKNLQGAHTVITTLPGGEQKTIFLEFTQLEDRRRIRLEYGQIVERYLRDGDYVLFNRQPSLHRSSIMAHRVKVMPVGDTFRLNLSCTTPYNADFDGDEMNLHAILSIPGVAELRELMAVNKQVLSAQTNKPNFGLVQDALTGTYRMTARDVFLTRVEVMDLMTAAERTITKYHPQWKLPPPAVVKPEPLWTGKQIYSLLLPPINLCKLVRNGTEMDWMDNWERSVLIERGEIMCGSLCKQTAGSVTGGIVHLIAKDFHMDQACLFLSDAQRMVNRWMATQGFSVGISDCVASPEVDQGVRAIIDHAYKRIDRINQEVEQEEHAGGRVTKKDVEEPVANILRDVINQTGRLAQSHVSDRNHIHTMITAGSKGNPINLSQIMACVGQQTIDGRRIHVRNSLAERTTLATRTLTCYSPGDEHPETHGFCPNSYAIGLEPEEMYMHAMGGREGLVDTAVKTSVTGYIQRRLLKAMEALQVQFDGTVRNAEGYIVDFCYGGDGMDAQFLEPLTLSFLKMDNAQLEHTFRLHQFDEALDPKWQSSIEREIQTLIDLRDQCRQAKRQQGQVEVTVLLPIHLPRVMQNELSARLDTGRVSQEEVVTPTWLRRQIEGLWQRLTVGRPGLLYLKAAVYSHLCSSQLCTPFCGWTRRMVFNVLNRIERLYYKSLANAGEMIGALASESIGEPATQLTLNSFHYSGVGNKNTTTGVPRLRELIDVTKSDKMRTPSLTITLMPAYARDHDAAVHFAQTLIRTTLGDVVVEATTIYEPDPLSTTIEADREMVQVGNIFRDHAALQTASRWVVRMVLNRSRVLSQGLTPMDVAQTVRESLHDRADVLYSPTNAQEWVLRLAFYQIREMAEQFSSDPEEQRMEERILTQTEMNRILAYITLGGIEGIADASVREIHRTVISETTGALDKTKEWVIDTLGTSMLEAWTLDGVDWTRTISNDLYEIYENLGIEAVAQVLYQEIKNVLADSYVNDRHIMAVVKTMCFRGYLMPMSRHGINRVDTGVLMRVSFEESMEQLINAAMFNEVDQLKGVTENMMVGGIAPMGTGTVSLRVDPEYQPLMDTIVYGRERNLVKEKRIFRSMITEWATPQGQPQDDLDHLDRPPSPPGLPQTMHETATNMEVDEDLSHSGPVVFSSAPSTQITSVKAYRPSSPVMEDEEEEKRVVTSGAPFRPKEFTSFLPPIPKGAYRPSSPDLSGTLLPNEMPLTQNLATFIPVSTSAALPNMIPTEQPQSTTVDVGQLSALLSSLQQMLK